MDNPDRSKSIRQNISSVNVGGGRSKDPSGRKKPPHPLKNVQRIWVEQTKLCRSLDLVAVRSQQQHRVRVLPENHERTPAEPAEMRGLPELLARGVVELEAVALQLLDEVGLGLVVDVVKAALPRQRPGPGLFSSKITTRGRSGIIFKATNRPTLFSIQIWQNVLKCLNNFWDF